MVFSYIYIMYFAHIRPHYSLLAPPVIPLTIPNIAHLLSVYIHPGFHHGCLQEDGWEFVYQSMGTIPVVTPLKKVSLPLPSIINCVCVTLQVGRTPWTPPSPWQDDGGPGPVQISGRQSQLLWVQVQQLCNTWRSADPLLPAPTFVPPLLLQCSLGLF